jgi:hypothetical protein
MKSKTKIKYIHMKKLFVIAALLITTVGFAQSNKEDVDIIQSMYGKEKKAIIAEFVKLEGAQSDAFWKLYDEYETQRKELGKKRIALLERYANSYMTLNDEETDKLMQDMMALGLANDKLQKTYYGKMKKAAGVRPAAQFLQIEAYLLSAVRATILENIPFIGELN